MSKLRFSFLGPRGTFTQQALNEISTEEESIHIPAIDSPRAIKMVRSGDVDFAVVPIENSVEGGINATLDTLAAGSDLLIYGEQLIDIAFTLAVRPGTRLEDITHIATHAAAWTQCRNWLGAHLPDVVHLPASSTAAGAEQLATEEDPGFQATLVSALAARQYGLESLDDAVADNPDAVTRFVLIGQAGKLPERTGADKTTLMVQLPTDEAGALLNMLEQFKARGISLSRIESRPVGDSLGRYAFSIDAEGHLMDERIQDALRGLHRVCPKVTFLGSYPCANGRPIRLRPGTADSDFRSAQAWVDSLVERSR
ncbi:prephenate dehydratase [Trueperella pyogenes]|uniref:prephenate dehydratase n=1 Tax=Trueperella pyogenes TaxID=1661 RepID=UPI0032485116